MTCDSYQCLRMVIASRLIILLGIPCADGEVERHIDEEYEKAKVGGKKGEE